MICLRFTATAGKPSQPVVNECGRDFVIMNWQPPRSDGGRSISGYNIEARQGFDGPWVSVVCSENLTNLM